ncbi:MAG: aromatic ring-hydroxylating dioxygenase subunit alpha [Anaerolineae bacterium]
MIPNQWYAILDSREVRPGRVLGVRRLGLPLAVWRDPAGRVVIMHQRCPHRGAQLSQGKIVEGTLECPFHGFRFEASGACTLIPASGRAAPVPKAFRAAPFPARESHGLIWMWWGEPRDEYPPLPMFTDIDEGFPYGAITLPWPVHYTRAIENQLDVSHLPFVHARTIGRGGRTLVNGPYTTLVDDLIEVWPAFEADAGTPALKPSEVPPPAGPSLLRFRFPNLWQNALSEDLRIFAAFAPVDEGNTVLYLRFYQRLMRVPVLRELICWLGAQGNRVVAREDKRVVSRQDPIKGDLNIGEVYIPADRPIAVYHTRRRELIESQPPGGTA